MQRRTLLYSKIFPVIENKAQKNNYDPFFGVSSLEDEVDLIDGILVSLGVLNKEDTSSLKKNQMPTIELCYRGSNLWPVLVCEQTGLLFCALVLVENESRNVMDHLSVSTVFSFLQKVMQVFSGGNEKLQDLDAFILAAAPLGRYICSDPGLVGYHLPSITSAVDDNTVSITVNEKVSCDSLGRENINGSIIFEPKLHPNNSHNCITLRLESLPKLDIILPASCVKVNEDTVKIQRIISTQNILYKLKQEFTGSKTENPEESVLQHDYKVVRNGSNFKLTLAIKLKRFDTKFKMNQFKVYWKPSAQFRLTNFDTSHGSIVHDMNRTPAGVTWVIGSKFPTKTNQRIVVDADVLTSHGIPSVDSLTASCHFRMENLTSALILSRESISITNESSVTQPSVKTMFQKTLSSADYRLTATLAS